MTHDEEPCVRMLISPDRQLHMLRKRLRRLDGLGRLTLVAEDTHGLTGLMVNETRAGPAALGSDGAVWAIQSNNSTLRRMSVDRGVSSIVSESLRSVTELLVARKEP